MLTAFKEMLTFRRETSEPSADTKISLALLANEAFRRQLGLLRAFPFAEDTSMNSCVEGNSRFLLKTPDCPDRDTLLKGPLSNRRDPGPFLVASENDFLVGYSGPSRVFLPEKKVALLFCAVSSNRDRGRDPRQRDKPIYRAEDMNEVRDIAEKLGSTLGLKVEEGHCQHDYGKGRLRFKASPFRLDSAVRFTHVVDRFHSYDFILSTPGVIYNVADVLPQCAQLGKINLKQHPEVAKLIDRLYELQQIGLSTFGDAHSRNESLTKSADLEYQARIDRQAQRIGLESNFSRFEGMLDLNATLGLDNASVLTGDDLKIKVAGLEEKLRALFESYGLKPEVRIDLWTHCDHPDTQGMSWESPVLDNLKLYFDSNLKCRLTVGFSDYNKNNRGDEFIKLEALDNAKTAQLMSDLQGSLHFKVVPAT
jgi:hypothetical protein